MELCVSVAHLQSFSKTFSQFSEFLSPRSSDYYGADGCYQYRAQTVASSEIFCQTPFRKLSCQSCG